MHFVRSKIASPFQLEKPVNPIKFAGRQTVLKNIRQMVGNMLVASCRSATVPSTLSRTGCIWVRQKMACLSTATLRITRT